MNDLFHRTAILIGGAAMEQIAAHRVILFGVGGVGSWCAEALIRSGLQQLTVVDDDVVCPSNVNRQLMATIATIGKPKVEVLQERLLQINPHAQITTLQKRYTAASAADFHLESYDYVVDAIDSLADKQHLILHACSLSRKLFSSMGAAYKLDPQRIRVAEFWQVKGCPLARALRNRFKRSQTFPSHKFQCVYSDELIPNREEDRSAGGTVVHITAVFGLTLASLVLRDIIKV